MAQTKAQSWFEAWANIVIGFGINLAANLAILPLFWFHPTVSDAFGIGILFTVISLVRSFVLRRIFNKLHG